MDNKFVTYIAVLWLFVVLDSFFIWNSYELMIVLFSNSLVLYVSFRNFQQNGLSINGKTFSVLLAVSVFSLWKILVNTANIYGFFFNFISLVTLVSIMLWPIDCYEKIYKVFRRFVIFICIGSSFVSLLTILGVIGYIPYFELPPRSSLHESLGVVYHVYGCFVTVYSGYDFLPRACGVLQEPGHFAIVLGFVYMADRLLKYKISVWVLVCGILTFSSNFPIIVFITEFYNILKIKNLFVIIKYAIVFLFLGYVAYQSLSKDMQSTVKYLAYERNLEVVVDAVVTSGSLTEALDERTDISGDMAYKRINSSNVWFGLGHEDSFFTLSDYRGIIMKYGLIGLLLIVLAIFTVTREFPWRQRIQVIAFLLLVLIHRSWMFTAPYLYFLPYMTSKLYFKSKINASIL